MRGAHCQTGVEAREQTAALCDEAAQHRVDQACRALLAKQARCVDRGVRIGFRWIAGIFDLMSRDDEQRPHLLGQPLGSAE